MASEYYRPCPELDAVNSLFDKYWKAKEYGACFAGLLPLAQQGYPLAECQVGYFYSEGLGVPKDMEQALYWTRRAAEHGDWDAQYNLGEYRRSKGLRAGTALVLSGRLTEPRPGIGKMQAAWDFLKRGRPGCQWINERTDSGNPSFFGYILGGSACVDTKGQFGYKLHALSRCAKRHLRGHHSVHSGSPASSLPR